MRKSLILVLRVQVWTTRRLGAGRSMQFLLNRALRFRGPPRTSALSTKAMSAIRRWDCSNPNETILDKRIPRSVISPAKLTPAESSPVVSSSWFTAGPHLSAAPRSP